MLVATPLLSFFSPTEVAGIKSFLESNNVDVWQIYSDGMADVRINKDLFETSTYTVAQANRECTKIANVEELVQQAENMTFQEGLGLDWFDEYVSNFIKTSMNEHASLSLCHTSMELLTNC